MPYVIITTALSSSAFFVLIVSMIIFAASFGSPSVKKIMTFFLEEPFPADVPFNRSKASVKALE